AAGLGRGRRGGDAKILVVGVVVTKARLAVERQIDSPRGIERQEFDRVEWVVRQGRVAQIGVVLLKPRDIGIAAARPLALVERRHQDRLGRGDRGRRQFRALLRNSRGRGGEERRREGAASRRQRRLVHKSVELGGVVADDLAPGWLGQVAELLLDVFL